MIPFLNFKLFVFLFVTNEKIKKIQLKQLSQKQVELQKTHLQRVKSHEEQITLYQHLFGQPPLQPDPELQAVKEEIARFISPSAGNKSKTIMS